MYAVRSRDPDEDSELDGQDETYHDELTGFIISISDGQKLCRQYGPDLTPSDFEDIQACFPDGVYISRRVI